MELSNTAFCEQVGDVNTLFRIWVPHISIDTLAISIGRIIVFEFSAIIFSRGVLLHTGVLFGENVVTLTIVTLSVVASEARLATVVAWLTGGGIITVNDGVLVIVARCDATSSRIENKASSAYGTVDL